MVNSLRVTALRTPKLLAAAANENASSTELALGCVAVLGRLAGLFTERRRQLAESVGLTDQQWHALEEVQTEHFMPSLFARERKSSAAAVSKILRQLTDKGLITGHVGMGDARQRSFQVTALGRETLRTLREGRQHAIRTVWLPLAPDELTAFQAVGTKVADRLEAFTRDPHNAARPESSNPALTPPRPSKVRP